MRRRQRSTRGGSRSAAVALALVGTLVVAGLALAAPTHRPHMGGPSVDKGTIYWDPARNNWTVSRWTGCRTIVRWYIEPNVPAGWHASIGNAVRKWDSPNYCGPDFVQTSSPGSARVKFRIEDDVYCGMDGVRTWYAIACRNYAASGTDQVWTVAFNTKDAAYGIGAGARFDVESVALNELGHVLYLDHNSNWTDGVVMANSCRWGSRSCTVVDDLGFPDWSSYTVSCANCGSRRSVLAGDWDTVRHIYGTPAKPCTTLCPMSSRAKGFDTGPLSSAALAAELASHDPEAPDEFWHDEHYVDE